MGDYLGTPGVVGFYSFPTPSPAYKHLRSHIIPQNRHHWLTPSQRSHHRQGPLIPQLTPPLLHQSPPQRPIHPPTSADTGSTLLPPTPAPQTPTPITSQNNQNTPSSNPTSTSTSPEKKKKKIFFTRSPSPLGYQRQRVKYTRLFSFSSNGRQKIFPLSELISPTGISPVPTIRAALFSQRANYPFPRKGQPSDRNG